MTEVRALSFTKLIVWRKSHEFVLAVLKTCERFPRSDYLRNQLQRAALSITSNVAEGFGRQSIADKKHFYVMARGSAYEVQNQLIVARDTQKINQEEYMSLAELSLDSIRLLHGLIRSLERRRDAPN